MCASSLKTSKLNVSLSTIYNLKTLVDYLNLFPVASYIMVYPEFASYKSGIFSCPKPYNNKYTNHAVQVIGYNLK